MLTKLATKKYTIPLNTILDHLNPFNRCGIKSKSFGRSTAISIEDEERVASGLLKMEKYGFGLSRKEVLELVGQLVKKITLKLHLRTLFPVKIGFLAFQRGIIYL